MTKKDEPVPGAPRRGHPSLNYQSIYVAPDEKKAKSLSNDALAERMSGARDPKATKELIEKVGEKRAKKMIDEAERAWGIPEKGIKGFIKRKLS